MKKLFLILCIMVLLINNVPVKAAPKSNGMLPKAMNAYESYMMRELKSYHPTVTYFTYIDINKDGVPELFNLEPDGRYRIYTYYNGEVEFLGVGRYDDLYYNIGTNILYDFSGYSSRISTTYYKLQNGELVEKARELDEIAAVLNGKLTHYINEKQVTEYKYNQYIKKLTSSNKIHIPTTADWDALDCYIPFTEKNIKTETKHWLGKKGDFDFDKPLELNTLYYYDLDNDGIEEKIVFTGNDFWEYKHQAKLYINNKCLFTMDGNQLGYTVQFTDFNKKDKKTEIVTYSNGGDSYTGSLCIYQYNNKKINLIYNNSKSKVFNSYNGDLTSSGNGVAIIPAVHFFSLDKHFTNIEDSYEDPTNMIRIFDVKLKLNNNKLSVVGGTYNVESPTDYDISSLANINVTYNPDSKSKTKFVLKKGTKITLLKMRYVSQDTSYIYINVNEKKGWIYLDKSNKKLFSINYNYKIFGY